MKRSGASRYFAGATVVAIAATAVTVTPRVVLAQDLSSEVGIARALWEHGLYSAAEVFADAASDTKPEALVIKALALGGRAKEEKNPKLLDEAKKVLAQAIAKKVQGAKDAEPMIANPPAPKFYAPDKELDFAWRLKSRGSTGLMAAEAAMDNAIKNAGFDAKNLREAKMIRADLYGERSRAPKLPDSDPAKRKAAFDKAKEILLDVAGTAGASADQIIEAKGSFYDLCYKRGQGLLDASKAADDIAVSDALKKEALDAFKDAVAYLEPEVKKLQEDMDKSDATPKDAPKDEPKEGEPAAAGPPKSVAERALVFANYYWPKCVYGMGRATAGKDEHDSLVKKAIEIYDDYNLRFGMEPQGREAAIDMSDAYHDIGDEEKSIIALDSALGIEADFYSQEQVFHHPDAKVGIKMPADALDVFARASLSKGKALKGKRDWTKALAAFDKVFVDAKASAIDYDKEPLGKVIKIERAEALAKSGKQKEALADLKKIIDEDQSGPTGAMARAMAAKLSGASASADADAGVNSARALQLMDEAIDKGEHNTAATWARSAIRLGKAEGIESKVAPRALFALGEAYFGLGRNYEAAIAYEEVARRFKDDHTFAPQAAIGAVKCYQIMKGKAPNDFDKRKYEEALKFLNDNFSGQGTGVGAFLLALELQDDGKYDEASKEYAKVPPEGGDTYDKALYSGALCRYLYAKSLQKDKKDSANGVFQETAAALQKAIDAFAKDDGVNDDRKKKRRELDADARFLLADVLLLDAVKKPEQVLPLLEKAETAYEGSVDRISRAGLYRILAYLKLGKTEEAEKQVQILIEKYKGKRTILACKDVANALYEETNKKKDMAPEERRKVRVRIAGYYARWIIDGSESQDAQPSVAEMVAVANRIFVLALDAAGLPEDAGFVSELDDNFDAGPAKQAFTDAATIYGKVAKSEAIKSLKDSWKVYVNWGESAGMVKDWATCKEGLEASVAETKTLDSTGKLDPTVLAKNKVLLAYYYDVGRCYFELGAQDKANYEKAFAVFNNVVNTASERSKYWWRAKLDYFRGLDARGEEKDFNELAAALRAMERNYPKFAEAKKVGLDDKFMALVTKLEGKGMKVLDKK
jgi:hypothetical protein